MHRAPLLLSLLLLVGTSQAQDKSPPPAKPLLLDTFAELDEKRWSTVRLHDTKSDRIAADKGKLVLALNTLGTDDKTVKLRGVRSVQAFELAPTKPGLRVEAAFDWNQQRNGSYLTMGVALLPKAESKAPRAAKEALVFEVVGVPPARNARPYLWQRRRGGLRQLFTEGWPQPKREDRKGRSIQRSRFTLEVTCASVRLLENDKQLHSGKTQLDPGKYRVLLFVTGHSNYSERSVAFDSVRVQSIQPARASD